MRRLTHRNLVLPAALATLVLTSIATVAPAARRTVRRPSVALTRRSPVTVGGRNFTPGRHVAVTLVTTRRFTRTATPGAGGRFTVSFPATIDRCGPWSVTAVAGALRVLLRSGAKPMCAPAGPA